MSLALGEDRWPTGFRQQRYFSLPASRQFPFRRQELNCPKSILPPVPPSARSGWAERSDFDFKVAPPDQLLQAAQALVIEGQPFPNQPNSQGAGFASSAGTVGGVFGVGVNGFHFENGLPPNRYSASGTWRETLTNNSAVTQVSRGTISVPAPTIRFFGVGNSFPAGADPILTPRLL